METSSYILLFAVVALVAAIVIVAMYPQGTQPYPVMPWPIYPHRVMPHFGPYWAHGGQEGTGILY